MTEQAVPDALAVSFASMVNVAVEYWRLSRWLQSAGASPGAGPARHAVRKIEEFLKNNELEVQALDGRPFDAGLAARVIDTVESDSVPAGQTLIDETLSPVVLWRGQVVRAAEVVTAKRGGEK
jgi:hypothetical protein